MEDILSLKASSRGKEFLERRRYKFWYTYVEPAAAFIAFCGGVLALATLWGAAATAGAGSTLWVYGHFFMHL